MSYYTIPQAAAAVGAKPSTIKAWIAKGILPAYRPGGRRILIALDDLDRVVRAAPVAVKGGAS